jgi:hypothetical protein
MELIPLGLWRFARAWPSTNLGANASKVGTSLCVTGGPCWSRYRSRSSAHRCAADFEKRAARFRSRYWLPSGSRIVRSASHPPRRYGRDRQLTVTRTHPDPMSARELSDEDLRRLRTRSQYLASP